ncbi:hypothetical protein [Tahibacter amnicola]|uniref:Uncharacterized protein n=1 Tax=Tahibacter amnicola TaxID=2976241 RepID=A0ABY6B7P5_9GAMM|nr:hypothetical protein [Tahibacter amnicola]UXI65792.1 hypothetical protein N4264_13560 [Tahibacter amnicola]
MSDTPSLSRRRFLADVSVLALALGHARLLMASPRVAGAHDVRQWLEQVSTLGQQVQKGAIEANVWRQQIDALNTSVALSEWLPALQFDRALQAMKHDQKDPAKTFVRLADVDGRYAEARFAVAYFVFARGQVITPHGHRGMLSAHAVVAGDLHVRTFDRLGTEPDALIIRPRLDQIAEPGFSAAIGEEEGNIHWFVARKDGSATLDVIVQDVDVNGRGFKLDLIDPRQGVPLDAGRIRAPLLTWAESSRRYQAEGEA